MGKEVEKMGIWEGNKNFALSKDFLIIFCQKFF
jgi:hypothetical protein